MDGLGGGRDLVPRRVVGQSDAFGREHVLAVHQHRRLAVERHRVEVVLIAEGTTDTGDQVVRVIRRVLGDVRAEVLDPSLLRPQRHLVGPDGEEVVASAVGGHVLGDLLPKLVLGQGHDLHRDVGVLALEVGDEGFQVRHLRVVDGGEGDRLRAAASSCPSRAGASGAGQRNDQADARHGEESPLCARNRRTKPSLTHAVTPFETFAKAAESK